VTDAPVVRWPPTHEQYAHLAQLAALIKQFGRERFVAAPIVRADEQDFPDTWERTLTSVHRVLYRLCWHAHWDPEVVVEDVRPLKHPDEKMLIASEMELASAAEGVVTIAVAEIGNDDVAGLLSHRVGQAFLEMAPGDPFRGTDDAISETAGSIAAMYLGFGVLVANSSMYRRYASKIVARVVVEEQYVAEVGGLSIADATFLLAVQDIVRDDVSPALFTLLKPQREWLDRWMAVLEEHEEEIRTLLEIDDAPAMPLSRRAVPRPVSTQAERDLHKFNAGYPTFRVPDRRYWPVALGVGAGIFGFLAPHPTIVGPITMLAGAIAGRMFVRQHYVCADTSCGRLMPTLVSECPGCGGMIVGTIQHANDRLDALEEWEREQKAAGNLRDEDESDEEDAS
jgi:hypothetical protein